MPATLKKTNPAIAQKNPATLRDADPARAYVDELGSIERELAPLKAKIARGEMLRKLIRESRAGADPQRPLHIEGEHFVGLLGACGTQTTINIPALIKRITAKAFAGFASCTLAALKEHTDAETVAAVTTVEQTGPRTLKLFEIGAA